jgi:dihydrofolate reductase
MERARPLPPPYPKKGRIDARRAIASVMVTLDDVMEAPEEWAFRFFNEELGRLSRANLLASDALLLGRATYEGFADHWPSATDETGLADRMNGMPKFVVSTTLEGSSLEQFDADRGERRGAGFRAEPQPGGDILVLASADLVGALTRHDLIDEYRLRVAPVVVESGSASSET